MYVCAVVTRSPWPTRSTDGLGPRPVECENVGVSIASAAPSSSRTRARETAGSTKPSRARARRPAPRSPEDLRRAVLEALERGGTSSEIAVNVRARRVAVEEVLVELESVGLAQKRTLPLGGWALRFEGIEAKTGHSGTARAPLTGHPCFPEALRA